MRSADDTPEGTSKQELFQAFSQLYEHDPELLDAMLASNANAAEQPARYIQGIVVERQVYIISNLATGESKIFHSTDRLWTIGRDPRQSDIAVSDKRLSRCHVALQYDSDQGFIISDLESTNGTYVNDKKLKRVYALRDGDRVRIGSSVFYFFNCNTHTEHSEIDRSNSTDSAEGGRTLH